MNLYFRDRRGDNRLIASGLRFDEEILRHIQKCLDEHNFKSYYVRTWYNNGFTWYDVGSHSEFFLVDANMMGKYEDEQEEEKTIYNTAQKNKEPLDYRPE
jgi:hypothetical protein